MAHVMVVDGTWPQAVAMAPLVSALKGDDRFDPLVAVAVASQHRELLDRVDTFLGITPNNALNAMTVGASPTDLTDLTDLTERTAHEMKRLLRRTRPDAAVVHGDTISARCAAQAAYDERIPVVHPEAGLRTGNPCFAFPLEANLRLISRFAALRLAPRERSRENLLREGIGPGTIAVTGTTVIDALRSAVRVEPQFSDTRIGEFIGREGPMFLVTGHLRESRGEPMREVLEALRAVLAAHPECRLLLSMHLDETVNTVVGDVLESVPAVLLTGPLGYHEFAHCVRQAHLVITDSGGVPEEAPNPGKPMLVLHDTTERPEALDSGTVRLVGTDRGEVLAATLELLESPAAHEGMAGSTNPYGDGHAAERAVAAAAQLLGLCERLPEFGGVTAAAEFDNEFGRVA